MLFVAANVSPSAIDGMGLFAREFVEKGGSVWEFTPGFDVALAEGSLSNLSSAARRQVERYSFRDLGTRSFLLPSDDARFINHSDTPKVRWSGHRLVAASDIFRGDEITANYADIETVVFPPYQQPLKDETPVVCEWKIVPVREIPWMGNPLECRTARQAVDYWKNGVASSLHFRPDVENLVALFLSVRYRVQGHSVISIGSLNETVAHPREVFRMAILGGAFAIILMHNHPSGDAVPSEADRILTGTFEKAGRLLQIKMADHIVVGNPGFYSFAEDRLFPR